MWTLKTCVTLRMSSGLHSSVMRSGEASHLQSASEEAHRADRTFFSNPPSRYEHTPSWPRWGDTLHPEMSSCTVWRRALWSRPACGCVQTALYVLIWKTQSQLSWLQFALISSQDLLFSLRLVNDTSLESETTKDLFALRDTEKDSYAAAL